MTAVCDTLPRAGALWGVLNFTNLPACDFDGAVRWFKPLTISEEYMVLVIDPDFNIDNGLQVIGSRYSFSRGVPVLSMSDPNVVVVLANGDLPQSLTNLFFFGANNKITVQTNKSTFTLDTSNRTKRLRVF